jgi:hypothetical protein
VTEPTHPGDEIPNTGRAATVAALVLVVVGIIVVAFRGSWGSLRDAALAAHFDRSAADLYPFAVDGLLIVAILAAVLLRHDRGARRYCLGIIATYTGASWLINFLHGLGVFSPDPVTGVRPGPPWYVVLVIASLVIGSIFLGSHLLIFVWRHVFPTATVAAPIAPVYRFGTDADRGGTDVPEPPADRLQAARDAYQFSRRPGRKELSQKNLMDQFGISKRQASQVQSAVKAEETEELSRAGQLPPPGGPGRNGQGTA